MLIAMSELHLVFVCWFVFIVFMVVCVDRSRELMWLRRCRFRCFALTLRCSVVSLLVNRLINLIVIFPDFLPLLLLHFNPLNLFYPSPPPRFTVTTPALHSVISLLSCNASWELPTLPTGYGVWSRWWGKLILHHRTQTAPSLSCLLCFLLASVMNNVCGATLFSMCRLLSRGFCSGCFLHTAEPLLESYLVHSLHGWTWQLLNPFFYLISIQ